MNAPSTQSPFDIYVLIAVLCLAILDVLHKRFHSYFQFFNFSIFPILAVVTPVLAITCVVYFRYRLNAFLKRRAARRATQYCPNAIYLGRTETGQDIYLPPNSRTGHAQVIGATSAGKTESIIIPWAVHDIESGSGLLIIDGKSDSSFLDKLYAHVVRAGRQKDFRFFSLANVDCSHTFNPLAGASADEATERVFTSFSIENSHYRAIQAKVFRSLVQLILDRNEVPTFKQIRYLLCDPVLLASWTKQTTNHENASILRSLLSQGSSEFQMQTCGLEANLAPFCGGKTSSLFNTTTPSIQFDQVLSSNQICYLQVPIMHSPFLAEATGKLILQAFQQSVSNRHLGLAEKTKFFACYLDDFQDYLYPGFGTLLNKSRSANIGLVLSHQALGDLEKVSPYFRNLVISSTNIKVIMRTIDPETCDFYAKAIGTRTTEKLTERQTRSLLVTTKTGEQSARQVEQYIVHPNELRQMQVGQGVITIPHKLGVCTVKVAFQMREALKPVPLPRVEKHPSEQAVETRPHTPEDSDPKTKTPPPKERK